MEYSSEYRIDDLIVSYYGVSLKNNLEFLNINSEEEKNILVSYFYQKIDFKNYDKIIDRVLQASVDRLNKNQLENKIELFLSDRIFPSIDKTQFIPPGNILSSTSLTSNVLRMFFKRILYQTILSFVYAMTKNKNFYKRSLETEIFYDAYLKLRNSLQQYNKAFLNFYTGLVNKYDITGDYIFPVYNAMDDNVYFSKVEYNRPNINNEKLLPLKIDKVGMSLENKIKLKEIQKCSTSSSSSSSNSSNINTNNFKPEELKKIHKFNKEIGLTAEDFKINKDNKKTLSDETTINLYKDPRDIKSSSELSKKNIVYKDPKDLPIIAKRPIGGAINMGDESVIVKNQLDKMFEDNIKHVYNKEEIKQLENLLENKKINTLIARKELKLSPGFNNIIQNILNKDINDTDRKKFFNEIFDVVDNTHLTKEELYDVYKNEPNKEGFIKYVVDKTMHQNIPQDCSNSNLKVVALVDNIFSKILKEDYDHNTLNLQDDDIKFILMLETLNSIKTSSIGNSSNITVNLFKDVDQARINKDEIKFN